MTKRQLNAVVSYLKKAGNSRRPTMGEYGLENGRFIVCNTFTLFNVKNVEMQEKIKAEIKKTDAIYPSTDFIFKASNNNHAKIVLKRADIEKFLKDARANKQTGTAYGREALIKLDREYTNLNVDKQLKECMFYTVLNDFMRIVNPQEEEIVLYYDSDHTSKPYQYKNNDFDVFLCPGRLAPE